jgi:hypothetical protein
MTKIVSSVAPMVERETPVRVVSFCLKHLIGIGKYVEKVCWFEDMYISQLAGFVPNP